MFRFNAKIIVVGLLVFAMVIPFPGVGIAASDSEEAWTLLPTGEVSEVDVDLSPTTVSIELSKTSWAEIYNDNNWLDIQALLINDTGNPGAVKFKVYARTSSSAPYIEIFASPSVPVGLSWTSPLIASSYNRYKVEAIAVTTAGTYSITYDDL